MNSDDLERIIKIENLPSDYEKKDIYDLLRIVCDNDEILKVNYVVIYTDLMFGRKMLCSFFRL
jgi:hypothetical protein